MKYIFIDTNQYRHIFSKNEGFSDEIKNLLDKLINQDHVKLLLPKQVKEEVERNRFENWYNDEIKDNNKKIENIKLDIKSFEESLASFPLELQKIKKKLQKSLVIFEKESLNIKKRYRELKSKANQKLKQLFDEAEFIDESEEIIYKARLRLDKNNPPFDNKLGDALIWESLLYFLKSAPKKSSLIFVARDGNAWGKDGFNPWLQRELKEKTEVLISLTRALSDIDYLTKQEQGSLRTIEREELKNNAISNFVNSRSFDSAGSNCGALLQYKDIFKKEDYEKIINASISNNQIYQSFFTSTPLNDLCSGEKGYVISYLENINKEIWDNFVKMKHIKYIRQSDPKLDLTSDDF
ncbi:MAG: PIN domain-containing protein [Minisyncoccia bacterium]